MTLKITEEEFKKWYPKQCHHLWYILTTKPKSKEQLLKYYLPSKLWRLNNLYTIKNKWGEAVKFSMNRAQFFVYSRMFIHTRLIILKSRQQGISTLYLVSFCDDTIWHSNLNSGLLAQDKDAASSLLEKAKFLWDNLNEEIKTVINRKRLRDNTSEMSFNNSSTLFIRTSFRSNTLQRLHVSELGKIANKYPEKAKEFKTGTLPTLASSNFGIIESTAEGANMFKDFWDRAVATHTKSNLASKDFLPIFLSWIEDPDCVEDEPQEVTREFKDYFTKIEAETKTKLTQRQKNFWVMQERELEGDIHQEYPATPEEAFAAAKDGTYWSRLYMEHIIRKRRKRENLFDRNIPVYVVMDLGRNDYFVLLFFQYFNNEIRIIDEYYNSGEGLKHYAKKLQNKRDTLGYNIRQIGLPHDAVVVDLSEENHRTRQQILYEYGVTNTVILQKQSVQSGIEIVREALPKMYLDSKCSYIDQCFMNYTKTWDERLEIWKDVPKRTSYAHGADCIRYMVQYAFTYLDFAPQITEERKRLVKSRKSNSLGI